MIKISPEVYNELQKWTPKQLIRLHESWSQMVGETEEQKQAFKEKIQDVANILKEKGIEI